ncbi:MAG: 4-(cytidine 5'-diphospho)-2-C-methyl-D-erythritol kinase, partial [Actinomycetota bacterium]|nr:4-(cytidine 5'-diphospho)-2-C-methyl-D-erythritol kinase [Actinomycetota bacterium]
GDRLDSGYHKISSVMQSLALADIIVLSEASELIFECDNPQLTGNDNLAVRAARLLRARFAPGVGASIRLYKKVPVAAGLGGGSADAAAVLIGLNQFRSLGLRVADLLSLAPELGADVAFCLVGGTALVKGFGEEVKPLSAVELGPVLVIKPRGGLAAGAVYERFDELGMRVATGLSEVLAAVEAGDRGRLISSLANDLEPAAISLLPSIAATKNLALKAGASACAVSGSGPAMFAFAANEDQLKNVAEAVAGAADTWLTRATERGSAVITDKDEIEALIS